MKLNKRENIIAQEAFMTGRIYSNMGEKESPVEIQEKLLENIEKALKIQMPQKFVRICDKCKKVISTSHKYTKADGIYRHRNCRSPEYYH